MSYSINNVCREKSYTTPIKSEYQTKSKDIQESKDNNKEEEKINKKKQMISQKEGQYFCTYIVDDEGTKTLVNKILIDQMEKQNDFQNSSDSGTIKSLFFNNALKNDNLISEYKNQLNLEAAYRKNSQEMMNTINGNLGNNISSKELNEIIRSLKM